MRCSRQEGPGGPAPGIASSETGRDRSRKGRAVSTLIVCGPRGFCKGQGLVASPLRE